MLRFLALVCILMTLGGCSLAESLAVDLVYDEVPLPITNVREDLAYVAGPEADSAKHRLDLFLPLTDSVRVENEEGWPTVVFVHGGGWRTGDKDLTVGGEDVYGNIGRFFARRGIGAATVNYRLLPEVGWRAQVEDVARAVAWLHGAVEQYGGNPNGLVVMGHSAGAQLITRVALDPEPLRRVGVSPRVVCGAMPVSGAALDLTDRKTFLLSDSYDYYAARFSPRAGDPEDSFPDQPPEAPEPWQEEASPVRFAAAAPPFLILYAGGETEALQRQARLLEAALQEVGAQSEVVVVPGKSHTRIVPTLSRIDQTAGSAMLRFVRTLDC